MKLRRRNVSSDRQIIVRHRTRSSTLVYENSEPIPIDLIIEILLRLPVRSIARCRCVSKLWSSILGLPYFRDLFLTRTYGRPQILFACQNEGEVIFFSSPQPKNLDENSPPLVVNHRMRIPCDFFSVIFSPIGSGLVYTKDYDKTGYVICNPSTGQSFTLPKMEKFMKSKRTFCGYDPIEKQFKVLSMALAAYGESEIKEHQILTLGSENSSWRTIKCDIPHSPDVKDICINGVLYYKAYAKGSFNKPGVEVICFDVRSEKYSLLTVMTPSRGAMHVSAALINYNGKLASFKWDKWFSGFEIYILEDREKQEWSKHVYELPSLWKNVVGEKPSLQYVGVIGANEIVFSSRSSFNPCCIVYYNIERKTLTRVEIKGMEAFNGDRVWTFLDHVDDVKLMKVV